MDPSIHSSRACAGAIAKTVRCAGGPKKGGQSPFLTEGKASAADIDSACIPFDRDGGISGIVGGGQKETDGRTVQNFQDIEGINVLVGVVQGRERGLAGVERDRESGVPARATGGDNGAAGFHRAGEGHAEEFSPTDASGNREVGDAGGLGHAGEEILDKKGGNREDRPGEVAKSLIHDTVFSLVVGFRKMACHAITLLN